MAGQIGFSVSGGLKAGEIVGLAALADELGYDSFWVAEGHGGDQFAILAACATATRRLRLGTSISSVFVRTAPTVAMAAATLDNLTGGRFVLGLGSSHKVQVTPEHGVAYGKPITRVRDYVAVIRRLLQNGSVSGFHGTTIDIERFDFWFERDATEIPIYLAGLFPKMLQTCGEIADGVILTRSTMDTCRRVRRELEIGAARAGRTASEVAVTSLLPTAVAGTEAEALDQIRPSTAQYAGFFPRYNRLMAESGFPEAAAAIAAAWASGDREGAVAAVPDQVIRTTAVAGTPAQCRDRIEAYRASGMDLPIISPRTTNVADFERAMRACAPHA